MFNLSCFKFHPDQWQLKRVQENEANRFCVALTFWSTGKVKISDWNWYKIVVLVNDTCKHGRYEKILNEVRMWCQTFKFLPCQDARLAGQMNTTHYLDPYDTHMDQKKERRTATVLTNNHSKEKLHNLFFPHSVCTLIHCWPYPVFLLLMVTFAKHYLNSRILDLLHWLMMDRQW